MPFRKLTKKQAAEIKRLLTAWDPERGRLRHSQSELARRFGVSPVSIHKIAYGKTHRGVPWPGER
jgi:transcriptional regulator with XRE-family HTH domain